MSCLLKYRWVRLPRALVPSGKGVLGSWARLAVRAAFRAGTGRYCGHVNAVTPGMWSGGIVGVKSILGVRRRGDALRILDELQALGYITYTLDPATKKLEYRIRDWVLECSGEGCSDGAVYATDGYGFICLPRNITQRLADSKIKFGDADAWLDLWCHTVWQENSNAFSYPVEFTYAGQDTPLVNVEVNDGEAIVNELKYGSVSGMKLDENGKALPGALFGLFRSDAVEFTEESALMTATSGEDGVFAFENLPVGDYIVRELTAPAGYVLSEELHQVSIAENAQVIELEVTNDPIRGSITLTKYDADYPDNRLTGAVFEVYRDVNGGRVLDDGDELLGEMDDEGEGVYWMRELDAGGYLVREAEAPEGYVLDENAYYVEITTDGEVCVVENEAGVGFLNQPLRGALKIVKTTDDGKFEGFAFRVSGVNGYDMTFTTDSNGEILIEGLPSASMWSRSLKTEPARATR